MTATLFVDRLRALAAEQPTALAIRAPGGERDFGGMVTRSERIAARLREAGCVPGDRIVVIGRPSLAWLDVMLGAMVARAAFAPFSTALTIDERHLLIGDARPRLVFADREFASDGAIPLETLDRWIADGAGTGDPAHPEDDDLFSIIYSSGTTGTPKGIAHSARARSEFVASRGRAGLGAGRLAWVSTSLYTNFSFLGIIGPLYHGAAVSVPPRFSPEGFLAAVPAEGITDISLVPVQVRRIMEHPDYDPAGLAGLKLTMISGSPIDLELKRRLVAEWPGTIIDSYGTTETGGIATLDLKAFPDKLDTVGRIMAGVEPAILDEHGRPLPDGEIGEIAAATPLPMDGYYNRETLTETSRWSDGAGRRHLRTGDVGWIGGDGFLRVTGRAKDMIISGGLNIYASDIEAALGAHEDVAEAAVIAIPDADWGERPYAIVVLHDGARIDAEELLGWLGTRVARTSRPAGVAFVETLPRNDMGKVLKRVLRAPFWEDRTTEIA
jgi:long-chain acyl-CoA synthetase